MRPGWLVVWVVAGAVASSLGHPDLANLTACCPGIAERFKLSYRCPDNTSLRLDCEGRPKYKLHPKMDNYRFESGNLVIDHGDSQRSFTKDRYCAVVDIEEGAEFVVPFLCFEEATVTGWKMMTVYSYCLLVSTVFLLFTFMTYCALPSLRDLQGKCVMCFVASLALGYFWLALIQLELLPSDHRDFCIAAGFLNYYLFLCIFFWLFVISFDIWRATRHTVQPEEWKLWTGYLGFGFGGPLVMLLIALVTHHVPGDHIKPKFGERGCWFSEAIETWLFFYGPMSVLLMGNITFFFLTAIKLWKDYRNTTPASRIKVLRFKCILYLKLFLTMGISWIFEIISFLVEASAWYVTDILNCLQGVIIFIVMIATRKRVLRALANSKTLGPCFNKSWQTLPDEESEEQTNREQIQLANQ